MKPLFAEGMVDEVALYNDARQLLLQMRGRLSPEDLNRLTKEQGVNLSTMVLYTWLKDFRHKTFYRKISEMVVEADERPSDTRLLIIPGMFYREHPELGGNGKLIEQIAIRCGIECCIVPVESTGSLLENANIITQYIRQYANHRIWLASVSKGSAEIGLSLNSLEDKYRDNVKGWISLCGIFKGSPVADIRLNNPLTRTFLRTYLKCIGADYRGIDDLRTHHPWWKSDLICNTVEMIHVQPVPLAGYVHPGLAKRYQQLAVTGPNDGTVFLHDLITRSGHIYPVWGVDHFFRDRTVVPLIYKLCRYIKEQSPQRSNKNEKIEGRYYSGSDFTVNPCIV